MIKKENFIFAKSFLLLALPIALQNMVTNLVSLIDNVMVTRLGTVPIAAVGLSNQIYFVYTVILFGLCGGSAVFLTQYSGKKDYAGIKRISFINMFFALSLAMICSATALFFPETVMEFLSGDPKVIKEGVVYLRWMSAGYLLSGITITASNILKNLEFAKITLIASFSAMMFNIFGDYVLIFGKLGFSPMGLKGAAIATVISRVIEASVIIIFAIKKIDFLRHKPYEYTDGIKKSLPTFLRMAAPVTLNEALWSIGTALLSVIYARISTEAVAATNISNIIYNLLFVLFSGMAIAAGIIVGKDIGMGKKEEAYRKTKLMSFIAVGVSFVLIAFAIILLPLILKIFNPEPSVAASAKNIFYLTMLIAPFIAYNLLNICGPLRTGGDVVFCMIADPATVWLMGIPFALISVFVFKFSIEQTFFLVHIEDVLKATLVWLRTRKSNWIKTLV